MINLIRKFKPSYEVYNFFKKEELQHNLAFYEKYGLKKKYYESISSKDFERIESPKNIYDVKDSATELPKNKVFQQLNPSLQGQLLNWSSDGFAKLEGFFTSDEVDAMNAEVDMLVDSKKAKWKYGNKIMFAIHYSDLLLGVGTNKRLMSILNLLMGKEVDLFQSINFLTGSQQRAHSDSIHMSTFPYGNLVAAWVALQDVSEKDGPLFYYPSSHKLPYLMNKDFDNQGSRFFLGKKSNRDYEDKVAQIIEENELKKEVFLPKKGDVFIWHANLLHGGEPHIDKNSTRKSMVLHYYTKDAICYHEVTQRPTLKPKL